MQSNEKVNMQNNEGEGKASGDTEPEKVAGMEKEGTEKSGEEETDNKTAEINEWANIGKERKETPPLLTRWLLTRNYCRYIPRSFPVSLAFTPSIWTSRLHTVHHSLMPLFLTYTGFQIFLPEPSGLH